MRGKGWRAMVVAALLGSFALLSGPTAEADEVKLIFATTNQPTAHLNARIMHPWAQRINEQGKGVIKIDVRDGPTWANHVNYYDRVRDDVVQIAWGIQSFLGGKFPRSLVVHLPFVADRAEDASVAYWRTFKSGVLDAEYGEIVPLFLAALPQAGVHTAKPLKSLDNLRGLKLTAGSKVQSEVITRLGGTPISLVVTELYEALQRGTVDGSIVQWTAFQPFRLAEVTTYHVEASLGGSGGIVFMSKKRWESLPAAARKILEANSGEAQSRRFGAFWDAVYEEGRAMVKGVGKHTIVSLSPDQAEKWRELVAPVRDDWTKTTPDGERVLAEFRKQIGQVKTGN
jgi:TRAP-type transport system periplasmic protein